MNPALFIRLRAQGGVITTGDAAAVGVGKDELARLVRAGSLVRVRERAYVEGQAWSGARPDEQQALRTLAVARTFAGRWSVSSCSAAMLHGLPLLHAHTDVHLSRMTAGPLRDRPGIRTHAHLPTALITTVRGVPVTTAAVAAVQTAAHHGLEAGVVAADAALRTKVATRPALEAALLAARLGKGAAMSRQAVLLADGRSESVGESLTRLFLVLGGLPAPRLQVSIADDYGDFIARVDLLFDRERVIVEFDGLGKYAERGPRALVEEKRREDALRARGYEVVRITWQELKEPALVLALVRAAFARSAQRTVPAS